MVNVQTTIYKCTCGATQKWRDLPGAVIPPVINCHSCKAGMGLSVSDQCQQMLGMFPDMSSVTLDEPYGEAGAGEKAVPVIELSN